MEAPKYNKSRVMKSAWSMFKAGKKYRNHVLTFSECLKEAWKDERSSYDKAMKGKIGVIYLCTEYRLCGSGA